MNEYYLMMTLNMKLKSSFGRVLLGTAMIRTGNHLLIRKLDSSSYMLTFLMCSHVLFEVLLVVEGLSTPRFIANTSTFTVSVMCSHMNI